MLIGIIFLGIMLVRINKNRIGKGFS